MDTGAGTDCAVGIFAVCGRNGSEPVSIAVGQWGSLEDLSGFPIAPIAGGALYRRGHERGGIDHAAALHE